MSHWFDLYRDSIPHDGASAPCGISPQPDRSENEELMCAWLRERHENIELGLYLDRVCELLGRILSGGEVTAASRRRARHLFREIESARRGERIEGHGPDVT